MPPAFKTEVTKEPSAWQPGQTSEATVPGTYSPINVDPILSPSPSLRMTEPGKNINTGQVRCGKTPTVDPFTGESEKILWEDWLSTLERAATWNGWGEEEKLLQLAGYLKGKALQEWNLMSERDRSSFSMAATKLKQKLDHGAKKLVAQDFRQAIQKQKESVSDFIYHLEKLFRQAYGREALTAETRDTLLYSQLQEGLRLKIMHLQFLRHSCTQNHV